MVISPALCVFSMRAANSSALFREKDMRGVLLCARATKYTTVRIPKI